MKRAKKSARRKQSSLVTSQKRWLSPAICLGLAAITWIVFGRTIAFGFFNYDDSFYVYQNPWISNGLTRAGLVRAFTHPLVGNWHPLTSFSLMLDAEMQITDLDPEEEFKFDLSRYNAQLVAGYERTLADGGLEVWMRDVDKLGSGTTDAAKPNLSH